MEEREKDLKNMKDAMFLITYKCPSDYGLEDCVGSCDRTHTKFCDISHSSSDCYACWKDSIKNK